MVPKPILVGGDVAKCFHRSSQVPATYFLDLADHSVHASSPPALPEQARYAAMPIRFQLSQCSSSLGIAAKAVPTSHPGASGSPLGCRLALPRAFSPAASAASCSASSASCTCTSASAFSVMMRASFGVPLRCHDPGQRSGWTLVIADGSACTSAQAKRRAYLSAACSPSSRAGSDNRQCPCSFGNSSPALESNHSPPEATTHVAGPRSCSRDFRSSVVLPPSSSTVIESPSTISASVAFLAHRKVAIGGQNTSGSR
jgi:hypothetical protein